MKFLEIQEQIEKIYAKRSLVSWIPQILVTMLSVLGIVYLLMNNIPLLPDTFMTFFGVGFPIIMALSVLIANILDKHIQNRHLGIETEKELLIFWLKRIKTSEIVMYSTLSCLVLFAILLYIISKLYSEPANVFVSRVYRFSWLHFIIQAVIVFLVLRFQKKSDKLPIFRVRRAIQHLLSTKQS